MMKLFMVVVAFGCIGGIVQFVHGVRDFIKQRAGVKPNA